MDPPIIDIMVIYTPATSAAHGGPAAVSALIALAVADVNVAFANSLINARLRLIREQEVQYTESGDTSMIIDHRRLSNPSDGFLDEVPGLGNAWGADLISLFVTLPGANQSNGDALTPASPSKYSVVIAQYATSPLWHFAHEIGHNLGCDHSWNYNRGPEFRWALNSLGNWQFCQTPCGPVGGYGDIMGHSDYAIPYYSNPDVLAPDPAGGDPCPTGFPPTTTCPCDCAGTINMTALIVSGYETATFFLRPTFHSDTQSFTFDITGPPLGQCKIESSSDLAQWTVRQIITLSATGTGIFSDNDAGSVSYRFYRAHP